MGRRFYKMSGSGNDFVFLDARHEPAGELESTEAIRAICARGTGVGADGLVVLEKGAGGDDGDVRLRYYNTDGSHAAMCGNATLCTANLAVRLGAVQPGGFTIGTDAGVVQARIRDGLPEFDLPPVDDAVSAWSAEAPVRGELRLGYATVGNPHVIVRVSDVERVDVEGRGRLLRHARALPAGANVNFVGAGADGVWRIRTYERGVEGETLACGTGTAATALMLARWGEAVDEVALQTRSGRVLTVRLARLGDAWLPSLRGEGRLVFTGQFDDLGRASGDPKVAGASRRSALSGAAS